MSDRRGRPSLLDNSKCEIVIALVSVGCSLSTAARYLGVHRETLRRHALRDPEFRRRLTQAEAALEWSHLRKVTEASGRSWRASAWMLERLNPERFGRRKVDSLTRRELDEVLDILARIVVEEIRDDQTCQHVLFRLQELHRQLGNVA